MKYTNYKWFLFFILICSFQAEARNYRVSPLNGELELDFVDFEFKNSALGLDLSRHYRESDISTDTAIGGSWLLGFERRLLLTSDNESMILFWPTGKRELFARVKREKNSDPEPGRGREVQPRNVSELRVMIASLALQAVCDENADPTMSNCESTMSDLLTYMAIFADEFVAFQRTSEFHSETDCNLKELV